MSNVNFDVAIRRDTTFAAAPSVTAWAETTFEMFTSAPSSAHGFNDNTRRPLWQ